MRIRWAGSAEGDLTQICDYLQGRDSPAAARRTAISIHKAIRSLVRFPRRGRIGPEPGTRELIVTNLPYLVVYRIREDVVEILRILHGAEQR